MLLQLNYELLHECLYVDELWYEMYMLKWYDDFMTLQLNDVYLWDYNVDVVIVVDVVKSSMSYVVVDVVKLSMSYVVVDVVIVIDVVKSLKLYVVVD